MSRVLILSTQSGDWEGLFIDGKLIDEGHTLGDGNSKLFLLEMAEKYNFKYADVSIHELVDEDDNYLLEYGNFPLNLTELKGEYNG